MRVLIKKRESVSAISSHARCFEERYEGGTWLLPCVVVKVALSHARASEEELDAIAADTVVARKQRRASYRPHLAFRIAARDDPHVDLHDVPRVVPHHRDMGVVVQVVRNRHRDRACRAPRNAVLGR